MDLIPTDCTRATPLYADAVIRKTHGSLWLARSYASIPAGYARVGNPRFRRFLMDTIAGSYLRYSPIGLYEKDDLPCEPNPSVLTRNSTTREAEDRPPGRLPAWYEKSFRLEYLQRSVALGASLWSTQTFGWGS